MDILTELKQLFCKINPGIDEGKVTLDSTFTEDLEMDSLGMIELSLETEDRFGINLSDEELSALTRVGELAELLRNKLGR